MKFSEFFKSKDTIQLDKKTLVILRWIALVGQYLTISVVYFVFEFKLHFFLCSSIIMIGVFTNLYLQFKFKKNQLNNFTSTFFLFYDLFQLSALLYLTGGITNPFSILLIVPAIVASTFLTLRSTINLSLITIIILIVLTIYNLPLPHYGEVLHFHVPDTYLYALPIAIAITLIFQVYTLLPDKSYYPGRRPAFRVLHRVWIFIMSLTPPPPSLLMTRQAKKRAIWRFWVISSN